MGEMFSPSINMKRKDPDYTEVAYKFVDTMITKADDYHDNAPLWYGWALREAFLEGIKWQISQKPDAGDEDGFIRQKRIYLELVKRKWAELHPTFTDCRWFERYKILDPNWEVEAIWEEALSDKQGML